VNNWIKVKQKILKKFNRENFVPRILKSVLK